MDLPEFKKRADAALKSGLLGRLEELLKEVSPLPIDRATLLFGVGISILKTEAGWSKKKVLGVLALLVKLTFGEEGDAPKSAAKSLANLNNAQLVLKLANKEFVDAVNAHLLPIFRRHAIDGAESPQMLLSMATFGLAVEILRKNQYDKDFLHAMLDVLFKEGDAPPPKPTVLS